MTHKKEANKTKIEYLYMLILLLYPLRKVFVGIDMMDAGYTLGNYRFFDVMDEEWKLATYLANVVGWVFSKLPFGDLWLGMNIYASLLIGITSVISYIFFSRRYERKLLLFITEIVAISLCWAPSVNLYQYMGYYLMNFAAMLIYKAITEEKKFFYIIAGLVLGTSVFVRMPNITYIALILPVWYAAWVNKENKGNRLKEGFTDTLYCIAGYVVGAGVWFLLICVKYGFSAYLKMINGLFGMTDTATDYKPTAMLTASWEDCIKYGAWLWLFVAYIIAGVIFFRIMQGRFETVKKIVYLAGLPVLLRLCYGRGMFGFDYRDYFSIYKWLAVFILMTVLICIFQLISKNADKDSKLWSVFILTMCFITPLGSNNGLYPTINNMFIIAPVSVLMIVKTLHEAEEKLSKVYVSQFAVKSVVYCILLCITIQSVIFGVVFSFHDERVSGEKRVKAQIESSTSTKGMYTTVDNNQNLNELGEYLSANNLLDKQVLLYGDIPAVSYIFDMKPAIFTTWADLDSKTIERLNIDLEKLTPEDTVVIVSSEIRDDIEGNIDNITDPKLQKIFEFIDKNEYTCDFENQDYVVYVIRE